MVSKIFKKRTRRNLEEDEDPNGFKKAGAFIGTAAGKTVKAGKGFLSFLEQRKKQRESKKKSGSKAELKSIRQQIKVEKARRRLSKLKRGRKSQSVADIFGSQKQRTTDPTNDFIGITKDNGIQPTFLSGRTGIAGDLFNGPKPKKRKKSLF